MNFPNNTQFSNFIQPHEKPPDPLNEDVSMHDYQKEVKGEYIEDCDPIKEETCDITDPKQIQPLQLPNYSQSPMQQTYPYPYPSNITRMQQIPSQQNLTPLQLIQQLSTYAATGTKRKESTHSKGTHKKKKLETKTISQPSVSDFKPTTSQQDTAYPEYASPNAQPKSSMKKVKRLPETSKNNNRKGNSSEPEPSVPEPGDLAQPAKSMIDCPVCGDTAVAHFHYGGMCCYSCKAFFRRVVNTNKATKYKCRSGSNHCDVSLANRRSCQACRYKKCVASGMKPGLVLSDDQCHKKFGPRKGVKDDRFSNPMSRQFGDSSHEEMDADIDDPGTPMQKEVINENDYSVLIDSNKSFQEQNRIGRQLFVSLFSTGSVSSEKMTNEELETFKDIDENLAMLMSGLIERQVRNSRKFLSFHQDKDSKHRVLFMRNGQVNVSDVVYTLVEQTVLVLKQNQDFKSISVNDQAELLETNGMVSTIISSLELYSSQTHAMNWSLTEHDFTALKTLNVSNFSARASFGLSDVSGRVEAELKDDMVKLFKFFDYFSHIGVPKEALHLLATSVIFSHDCCDVENREKLEKIRRRYLILLFECISHSEGILGACNMGLRLHTAIHHLNRICQLLAQKFVNVQE